MKIDAALLAEMDKNDLEVQEPLSPEDQVYYDEMEAYFSDSLGQFKEGQIINGKIIGMSKDNIVVDVGFKSEGVISMREFPDYGKSLAIGDEVEVYLERVEDNDGNVVLSKDKAIKIKIWDNLVETYEADEIIEGVVVAKAKGGLTVDIGLRAFLPGSQIDLRPIRNLEKLIGETFKMKIIKMNKKRGNIVLSRRILLEEQRKQLREGTLEQMQEGNLIEGIVKNITEYGVFIDLGGMDGLLHITDMSWGRVNHPSEMFAIGDMVKVMVLKYDKEKERVSLGLKQITPDPWVEVEGKFPVDTRITGKVVSITNYGVFVELEKGIEGLVHISEMSWSRHVKHPSKMVALNDEVEAVVLTLDKERKRISLGMKQIEANPWEGIDQRYPIGTEVEGTVRNLTDFGAFIELEDGVDGLIHFRPQLEKNQTSFRTIAEEGYVKSRGPQYRQRQLPDFSGCQTASARPLGRHREKLSHRHRSRGHDHQSDRVWRVCRVWRWTGRIDSCLPVEFAKSFQPRASGETG